MVMTDKRIVAAIIGTAVTLLGAAFGINALEERRKCPATRFIECLLRESGLTPEQQRMARELLDNPVEFHSYLKKVAGDRLSKAVEVCRERTRLL